MPILSLEKIAAMKKPKSASARKSIPSLNVPKLYRIEEITHHLNKFNIRMSRQTIHNYTLLGLIKESTRTPAGHRLYPESVFDRLARIERLKRHHPLSEIKEILSKE
ncbi:MAG: MerR family transcriptional regulator [Planctomycetes bacterium]|nr:MerR family transcriptional regulator [Planctomycetota bacterium]